MIVAALIVGCSLVVSAAILFAALTNQRTQVVYVPATSEELMLELLKMTTKEMSALTKKGEDAMTERREDIALERIVFFPEEVLSLNDYQLSGSAHPFTCLCGADLVATTRGWICCLCNYTQDWAHTFMKDGSWRKMRPALPSAPLSLESGTK